MTDALMCLRDAQCQARKDGQPDQVLYGPQTSLYSQCWGFFENRENELFKIFEKKPEALAQLKEDALKSRTDILHSLHELGCFKGPKYWAYKLSGKLQ